MCLFCSICQTRKMCHLSSLTPNVCCYFSAYERALVEVLRMKVILPKQIWWLLDECIAFIRTIEYDMSMALALALPRTWIILYLILILAFLVFILWGGFTCTYSYISKYNSVYLVSLVAKQMLHLLENEKTTEKNGFCPTHVSF